MERLITMVDYIEHLQNGDATIDIQNRIKTNNLNDIGAEKYWLSIKYKDFLKQPLKLGYFIPCDLEGNIIEQPTCLKLNNCGCGEEQVLDCRDWKKEYREAQERVLFKNINLEGLDMLKHHISQKRTIEYMVQFNLELTENAKKQFNLK